MKITKDDISINIQAHRKRAKYIPYLKEKLGSNVTVIWDRKNDVWDTRMRCLKDHIKKGKKYSLTIQDDCLITDNFIHKIVKFINKMNLTEGRTLAYNFYFPINSRARVAAKFGYYKRYGMKSGLAICIPTNKIKPLIEFWEGSDAYYRNDDSRIGIFLRNINLPTFHPFPSLIQHRDSPSLIYKKGEMPERRKAEFYDGEE